MPDWRSLSKEMPGIDSLESIFDSSPDDFFAGAETIATQGLTRAGNLQEINKQAAEIYQAKKAYTQIMKPDDLKSAVGDKAQSAAPDYFANHAEKLTAAQSKVSGLMNKYRSVTNSSDLSNAVKKTSLEGKTFKERIVLGGNFNVVSTSPVSVDLAPLIGYRLNSKFYTGISAKYRQTFGDSLKLGRYITSKNSSLRLFVNYDLIKNFFGYVEIERAGSRTKWSDAASLKWTNNYFLGLGRKMLIHPKLYMTITALYNLNSQEQNITYPNRFQVRLGFQTSDLAFRKKNVYYDR
jgi:hypothetical protein